MAESPSREALLKAYEDLRVADVRDGMDAHMLHHVGSMDPSIRPLYRTTAVGIAKTVRHVPYSGSIPKFEPRSPEYEKWVGWYYGKVNRYPWMKELQDGDFLVIDQCEVSSGLMGSQNSLDAKVKGVRGIVTNGGPRDTDELIAQECACWSKFCSQAMVQGRLQYDAHDVTVSVGGVTVHPGDVVVADGDGVIVVPQDIAISVAEYAHDYHNKDKKKRREGYDALGMKPDHTL